MCASKLKEPGTRLPGHASRHVFRKQACEVGPGSRQAFGPTSRSTKLLLIILSIVISDMPFRIIIVDSIMVVVDVIISTLSVVLLGCIVLIIIITIIIIVILIAGVAVVVILVC